MSRTGQARHMADEIKHNKARAAAPSCAKLRQAVCLFVVKSNQALPKKNWSACGLDGVTCPRAVQRGFCKTRLEPSSGSARLAERAFQGAVGRSALIVCTARPTSVVLAQGIKTV